MTRLIDVGSIVYSRMVVDNGDVFVPLKDISDAPTIDAVQVVRGEWLKVTGMMPPEYFGRHVCSVCDHFAPNEHYGTHEWLSPICPNCGSKMDKQKDGKQNASNGKV